MNTRGFASAGTWTLAAAALALAGCSWLPSVGPDYEEPAVEFDRAPLPDAGMPTTNRTATGEYEPAKGDEDIRRVLKPEEIAGWWKRFNDPVLEKLVEDAVSNNTSYLVAQEKLEASRWQLVGTYAAFMPKVSADGGFTRMERGKDTSTMAGTGKTLHRDLFTAGFDASWEIDIFGGSRRSTESAMAEAEAAGWNVADALVSLTSEMGRQYLALRTVQQRIDVARTNLVLQIETYDILKSRLDSGIGDELAVSQSKYIVEETRATIPALLAQEESLKNAIAILAGEVPGALHAGLAPEPERDWLIEPVRLEGVPLDVLRTRPDVRAAERRLAAQCAKIGVAKSMWYPRLFINGSLGLESVKMDKLAGRGALYGSLGPSVSWPIFQGGSIYSAVKAEEALTRAACLEYELAVETAFGEVRDAYSSYTQEYHRYKALDAAVKAASDAVAISKDLYKNGLKDFTAVIDAQRSLLTLEEALVVSRGLITQDAIALFKALGGGMAAPAAEQTPAAEPAAGS